MLLGFCVFCMPVFTNKRQETTWIHVVKPRKSFRARDDSKESKLAVQTANCQP